MIRKKLWLRSRPDFHYIGKEENPGDVTIEETYSREFDPIYTPNHIGPPINEPKPPPEVALDPAKMEKWRKYWDEQKVWLHDENQHIYRSKNYRVRGR